MNRQLYLLLATVVLASCSSLPNPNVPVGSPSRAAVELLEKSAAQAGRPWHRMDRVEVAFDGKWTNIVKKLQPELVDAGYRGSSREVYFPRSSRVQQVHRGPNGVKTVVRTPSTIEVTFNGQTSTNEAAMDAAALVAEAYTVFLFGSDHLLARGSDWRILPTMQSYSIGDDPCKLVLGTIKPGFGRSKDDKVIAWISQKNDRLRRIQFTLNGLASTGGADVDVTFSDFQPGPLGAEWPRHFLETVRRPLTVKAHEWRMTDLKVR